jgi:hypothetical protein
MKIFLSILLLAIPLLFLFINQAYSSINDIVYPADSKIEGLTYKQWAPKFWQWWVTLPNAQNATAPSGETDAMHDTCFLNNNSPVIMLANPIIGAYVFGNTPHTYECTIPHDKPILVVGIDEMCNYNAPKENDPGQVVKTDEELKDCVHARNPYASVTFTVDNESIKVPSEKNENGHSEFSLTTDYFNITIPKGSMVEDWGLGTNRALLESKLIILKPLPVGDHTIGIKTVQIAPNEEDNLNLDMKYIMHVK